MSEWKIDRDGVRAVLDTVFAEAVQLDEQTTPQRLTGVLDSLSCIPADLSVVIVAVDEALAAQAHRVNAIKMHVAAGQHGVAAATSCYDHAQLEMAAQAQDEAALAAVTGDFTYFTAGGTYR